MIRALFDANVLPSGFPAPSGTLTELLDHWDASQFELVVSEHILEEVQRAWTKPYWHKRFDNQLANRSMAVLREHATMTPITEHVENVATHSEDDLLHSAAVNAGVDYLVTGDRGLLGIGPFRGISIVTHSEFVRVLNEQFLEPM